MLKKKLNYCCLLALVILVNIGCDSNKQRTVIDYYDDGTIESEIQVIGNKENGISKHYYPSGKLHLELSVTDDKLEGEGREYFEDGSLKSVRNYKNDELHGWVMDYDQGEVLRNRTQYSKGRVVFNVSFYPSGDTSAIHENGRTFLFYETGRVKQVLCTNDIEIFGLVKFSADGNTLKREGPLNCLTKEDSLLLERQYPSWHDKHAK
ncbi:toxin-antitoxin system YwqK family antitoxin [Pontibacter lucknowensis]|nr:hypothetical protein [Pontibacter lucknowensis]